MSPNKHNIACSKCLIKADFYINEDNILDNINVNHILLTRKRNETKFKVVTICPHCDEVYVLDGSL